MERKIKGIAALFCAFVLLFVSGCYNDYLDDTDDVVYNGSKYFYYNKMYSNVEVQQNRDVFVGHLHRFLWRAAPRVYLNKKDVEFNVLFSSQGYVYLKEGFQFPEIGELEITELAIRINIAHLSGDEFYYEFTWGKSIEVSVVKFDDEKAINIYDICDGVFNPTENVPAIGYYICNAYTTGKYGYLYGVVDLYEYSDNIAIGIYEDDGTILKYNLNPEYVEVFREAIRQLNEQRSKK